MTTTSETASTPPVPGPRYPKTDRQAEIMAMAEELSTIASANAATHDHDGTFPHDTFDAISKTPYLALTVPERWGGGGASPLDVMLAQEILAQGDGAVALVASMHLGHVAGIAVNEEWLQALKERFFRKIVECGALYNTAASEPGLGSPSRGGHFETRAVRDASGGWRINGRKAWGRVRRR